MESTLGAADVKAVRQIFDTALGCVQRGDWEGWAACYAEDAILHGGGIPPIHGREAILEWGRSFPIAAIDYDDVRVFGDESGGLVYATSAYSLELEDGSTDVGKQLVVLRRTEDGWSAVAVCFSSNASPS